MFHVEHGNLNSWISQSRRRFRPGHEYLRTAAMQILEYSLLMMAIQFGCQIIKLQNGPGAIMLGQLRGLCEQQR